MGILHPRLYCQTLAVMPQYPYPIFFVLENGDGRLDYWS